MMPFEQCLASLIELAETNDPNGMVFVEQVVRDYLASPEGQKDAAHPCDDLAGALMQRAPETDVKNLILDELFRIEGKTEGEP